MKRHFGLIGLLNAALLLPGCLGGEIVGRHLESPADFPSLSTVPDRPLNEEENIPRQKPARSSESLQKAKEFNQELRLYFGVPDAVDGEQSIEN